MLSFLFFYFQSFNLCLFILTYSVQDREQQSELLCLENCTQSNKNVIFFFIQRSSECETCIEIWSTFAERCFYWRSQKYRFALCLFVCFWNIETFGIVLKYFMHQIFKHCCRHTTWEKYSMLFLFIIHTYLFIYFITILYEELVMFPLFELLPQWAAIAVSPLELDRPLRIMSFWLSSVGYMLNEICIITKWG